MAIASIPPTADAAAPEPIAATVATRAGTRIHVDPRDERARELARLGGNLNPQGMAIWHKLLAEAAWTDIIDVGANYGEMLVHGGLPPAARIVAIEPNSRLRPYLAATLAEAEIDAEILDVAVSDRIGVAELVIHPTWSGMSRLAAPPVGEPAHPGTMIAPTGLAPSATSAPMTAEPGPSQSTGSNTPAKDRAVADDPDCLTVATTTLAALIVDRRPAATRLLIKVDVEGLEADVLRGLPAKLDSFADFAGMIEILHMSAADRAWLIERFAVELYRPSDDRLLPVAPPTLEGLLAALAEPGISGHDAAIRRRARPAGAATPQMASGAQQSEGAATPQAGSATPQADPGWIGRVAALWRWLVD